MACDNKGNATGANHPNRPNSCLSNTYTYPPLLLVISGILRAFYYCTLNIGSTWLEIRLFDGISTL